MHQDILVGTHVELKVLDNFIDYVKTNFDDFDISLTTKKVKSWNDVALPVQV